MYSPVRSVGLHSSPNSCVAPARHPFHSNTTVPVFPLQYPRTFSSLQLTTLISPSASLKHAPPSGVYVALNPGDPTLWSGVIFVRKGTSPFPPTTIRHLDN